MKKHLSIILLSAWGLLAVVAWSAATCITATHEDKKLVWADEFDENGLPDPAKWGYDIGDGCPQNCGWGNNELQYYTADNKENARIENGHLIIEAHKEPIGTKEYSSARMVSKNKGDWTYGRMVIRAKLPQGKGVWPAIWMLPTDWAYGAWPASGEIDIMEFVGYMPDSLFGTVHTTNYNHVNGTQVSKSLYSNTLSSEFHQYAIEWDAKKIDFYFDGSKYLTFTNRKEGSAGWPFDRDFHMVLNMA
ncbi:MAG: glycoside hydrolase family 16 protein, partial [Bacteroidota bacterium]|nr:glycoside hydrolase family 16 protein [Bacteroidota bacterium]